MRVSDVMNGGKARQRRCPVEADGGGRKRRRGSVADDWSFLVQPLATATVALGLAIMGIGEMNGEREVENGGRGVEVLGIMRGCRMMHRPKVWPASKRFVSRCKCGRTQKCG